MRREKNTLNFFGGFAMSTSDMCRRGQSTFMPLDNCTSASKFPTLITLAFTNIPGFTSECVKIDPSKALACEQKKNGSQKILPHPNNLFPPKLTLKSQNRFEKKKVNGYEMLWSLYSKENHYVIFIELYESL